MRISIKHIEGCKSLVFRTLGPAGVELVTDLIENQEYGQLAQVLEEALSTRGPNNVPIGKMGLPLDRFAAETVIKQIGRSGRTLK